MKKTLETSKGRFVVMEVSDWRLTKKQLYELEFPIVEKIGFIHNITEKQASEIVKMTWINDDKRLCRYKNYDINGNGSFSCPIKSLYSIIESQGIEITNNTYIFKV